MAKTFGLGKGLGALMMEEGVDGVEDTGEKKRNLPDGVEADENGQLWIKASLLKPNPHQPRQDFDEESLAELAESIRTHGILQAITVEDAGDGFFYIIAGERRTKAAILAGLEKVPVQLRHFEDDKKLEIALIENIQRADLNAIEEALAYKKLMQLSDITQEEVAKRVGKKRTTITNALRLLDLPEDIQSGVVSGQITAGHARAILSVEDNMDRHILFGKIVGGNMTVREAESAAAEMKSGESAKSRKSSKPVAVTVKAQDPDIASIEEKFREALGTKVVLKGDLNGGTLQIEYFSQADLDRLYNLIVKEGI